MKALDDEIREKADAGVKALLDGVELTERELIKVLEKHGVKRLEPLGRSSTRTFIRRCSRCPTRVPAGTVVQVMQPGYTIGERVLRPALVGVVKGGPKALRRKPPRTTTAVSNLLPSCPALCRHTIFSTRLSVDAGTSRP